jgi:hypothetical protein
MLIKSPQVIKTYQADVTFDLDTVFLTEPKANEEFKQAFSASLLEAKSYEAHWQNTRAHMKAFAERELGQSLPDIGFWQKDFKQAFRNVLSVIDTQSSNI